MKNYIRDNIKMNRAATYFIHNEKYYIISAGGTALYLAATTDPEKLILDAGAISRNGSTPFFDETTTTAETATETAEYYTTVHGLRARDKCRVFIDEAGVLHKYDNKLFADFEKKPNNYKLFTWEKQYNSKCLSCFYNDLFLGMILPIRLKPEQREKLKEEAAAAIIAEEKAKEEKAAAKAARAASLAQFGLV